MHNEESQPSILYATSLERNFNPGSRSKNSVGKAFRKYIGPKNIEVRISKQNTALIDE